MKLFSPIRIGAMEVRNRWVMSAMTTNYAQEDQRPSQRLTDFLVARARGGVGLITVEVCTVDPAQKYQPQSMTLGADEFIAPHRALTRALHVHGVKVQPQLTHPGPESMSLYYRGELALGPSAGVGACTGLPSRELALDELDGIVEAYAQAARRAREADYDGIELHAAHAYMLLGCFLSPLKNKRQDEYGADTAENRTRLLIRVLRRIKEVAGRDFPVTLRVSGFERAPGGRDADDTALIAPRLVAAGVDAFHVSGGVSDPMVSQMVCGPDYPDGYNVAAAQALRRVVDVPVMVVGRILDPEYAERILREERADMIVMARPFLADPDIPRKTADGELSRIRRCISCQNCIDSMFLAPFDANMNCAVNPATGREGELNYRKATRPRHVVVVGGGPAGMEAARVACERGHRVTLLEARRRLGGALTLAATVHRDNERFLDYLLSEMRRLPIDIRLGVSADLAAIHALQADVVVVATGAALKLPALPGLELPHVLTGRQLRQMTNGRLEEPVPALPVWARWGLRAGGALVDRHVTPARLRRLADLWLPVGRRVIVIGGDLAAIEVAEFLARRGRGVTVLSEYPRLAPEIGPKRRLEHEQRLDRLGVSVNSGVRIRAIVEAGVETLKASGEVFLNPADTVIVAGEPVAELSLFETLQGAGLECYSAGDCSGLGLIVKAAYEGNRAAHRV